MVFYSVEQVKEKIRQKTIEENLLEAVIGLPANLFFGTGIPAAILIFNRAKGNNTNVLFVDASQSYLPGKNQNVLRLVEDIDPIVDAYHKFNEGKLNPGLVRDKYSYVATFEEIVSNDFNLNIPRYVDTFEEESEIDVAEVQKQIEALESELKVVQSEMAKYLKDLTN